MIFSSKKFNQESNKGSAYFIILSQLLQLAIPLILANIAYIGMQVVDTIMMGFLGPIGLAVGALGGMVVYNTLVFCLGILSATGTWIAQSHGAKNHLEMSLFLRQGVLLAAFLSLPCIAIIIMLPKILLLFGLNPTLIEFTKAFLNALAWGIPGWLFFSVLRDYVSILGYPKIVRTVSFLAVPVNALLNYILMFGKIGFPALGIAGIGYSTSIVRWGMLFTLIVFIYFHENLSAHLFLKVRPFVSWSRIKKILILGYPTGLIMGFEIGMFSIITGLMGAFGIFALAAHQIAIQCTNIVFNIPLGISQAASIQVAHATGAKQNHKVRQIAYMAITLGIVFALIVGLIMCLLPLPIIKIFLSIDKIKNSPIELLAITFLAMAALLQLVDSVQVIILGILRGMGDTFLPMLFGVGAYWVVGLSSGYILGFTYHWEGVGLWAGLCLGIGCSVLLLLLRFFKCSSRANLALSLEKPVSL